MTPEALKKPVLWRGMVLAGGMALFCGFVAAERVAAADAAADVDDPKTASHFQPPSGSRICKKLNTRLEKMCQRNYLSDADKALCARVDTGLPGLCGDLDVVLATAAAEGPVLDALGQEFEVLSVEGNLADLSLHPLVVGPEDLKDPELTDYLAEAYAGGQTIAILGASQAEADLFHSLAAEGGAANCAPDAGAWDIAFYGLHRSITKQPPIASSYCLPALVEKNDDGQQQVFRYYFAPEFPVTPAETFVGDFSEGNTLEELATTVHCQATFSPLLGTGRDRQAQMSVNAFIRSVRSFSNQRDYYDFNVFANYKGSTDSGPKDMKFAALPCDPNFSTQFCVQSGLIGNIVAASPKTAVETSDYTKGFDFATSGGFRTGSESRGYLRLAARTAMTIAKAVSVKVAKSKISAKHDLGKALLDWEFKPKPNLKKLEVYSPEVRWLWSFDRSSYPDDGVVENGHLTARILMSGKFYSGPINNPRETRFIDCNMPYPWPRWEVDTPVIANASPDTVRVGENFFIEGSGFYDGIVENVVIGGKVVPEALYRVEDAETIRITVPFDQPTQSAAQIQVTTNFDGQPLDSNSDVTVEIKDPLLQ